MANKAFHEATNNENYDTDRELVFGYDLIDGKLETNPGEAQVVKYVFSRYLELSNQYPAEQSDLVDQIINDEIKEKWPEEYESLIRKRAHNEDLRTKRFPLSEGPHIKEMIPLTISDIVSRELWEEVQTKIKETSTGMQAPDVGDMTQSFT